MATTNRPQVRILSGVRANGRCGIFDYSERLTDALGSHGIDAAVLDVNDWRLGRAFRVATTLLQEKGVVHVQFPSQAMSKKIAPHFILCSAPFATRVATFHEFSQMTWRGKLLALPSMLMAHRIIASHEGEAAAITRTYPFVRQKVCCIPIASNIPAAPEPVARTRDVCFFGMIGDNPQVRRFLKVMRCSGLGPAAVLIGHARMDDSKTVAIVEEAKTLGVELALNRPSEEVAALLATAKVALLPYKDGISERRGSALAAMANGALVVTTPPEAGDAKVFDSICLIADVAQLTEATLRAVTERARHGEMLRQAKAFAAHRSWGRIAEEHLALYDRRTPPMHPAPS